MVQNTKYKDKLLKATFDIPYFYGGITSNDLLFKYKSILNEAILNAIRKLAGNPDFSHVPSFIIETVIDDSDKIDVVFNIDKNTVADQLHMCLDYYVKCENYEVAAELSSIREKLNLNL